MNEKLWLPIKGYEGLYEVSNTGLIRSRDKIVKTVRGFSNRKGKLMKLSIDKYGYYKIVLQNNTIRKYTTVHRVVGISFLENPLNLPQINHKDGNKLNNNVDNLEWCTNEYNLKHAHENGLIDYTKNSGENCYITKLTNEIVIEIRKKMKTMKNKEIEQEYNLSRSTVSRIRMNHSFKNII